MKYENLKKKKTYKDKRQSKYYSSGNVNETNKVPQTSPKT